jgi:hypothetical protein
MYWQYMAQQQLLRQESSVSQTLRAHKKQLTQNIERNTRMPNISTASQQSNQESSISQIIRTYGKQFIQIRKQYTDGLGGRLYAALVALRQAGISKELLIELNDSGATFDEIADYLDRNCNPPNPI